jgi:hypothetical protein
LWRNEALSSVEEFRDELEYQIGERKKGADADVGDLREALSKAREAVQKYLSFAPEEDVRSVREALGAEAARTDVQR